MIGYIIVKRRRVGSKMEVAGHSNNQYGAENYAQDIYHAEQLDLVLVAEVYKDYIDEDGVRYHKVFRIERTCKHKNIQHDLFLGGAVCMECNMVFKPCALSSNIEDSLKAQLSTV